MHKKTIFILIASSFLLTACSLNKENKMQGTNTMESKKEITESNNLKGSITDLLKTGKSMKCTGSFGDADGKMEMTSYISGEKVRTDTKSTTPEGEEFEAHFITDGKTSYSWTSMQEQGFKMEFEGFENMETPKTEDTADKTAEFSKDIEAMKNVNYECDMWIVDMNKFTPPTNIEFVDMNNFLKSMGEGKDFCGMCELSGDATAIAECKKNLGC